MVQGFYGLDEAAAILGMPADQLNQMAQKREIRAFADRGTWRFRTQDVDEMARRLGRGSNPELQLGEAPPKPAAPRKTGLKAPTPEAPKSGPRRSELKTGPKSGVTKTDAPGTVAAHAPVLPKDDSVFDFPLSGADDQVEIGQEVIIDSPTASRSGRKSQLSPAPQPGTDSDVHLVIDPSDGDVRLVADSNVNVGEPPPPSKTGSKSGPKRVTGLGG